MPKMGLERAGEREREEVGVHDGLDMSKVSCELPAPNLFT